MQLATFILAAATFLFPGKDHGAFAQAAANVIESEAPLFDKDDDRHKTAALIAAIAYRESGFKLDAVGDHGQSVCAMQIRWGSKDLLTDPEACIRTAMGKLRKSIQACPSHPLAIYAGGSLGCTQTKAQRVSFDRVYLSKRVLSHVQTKADERTEP